MAAVSWFMATAHRTIFKQTRSALNEFKPEPPILSDQVLNFAFTKFTK